MVDWTVHLAAQIDADGRLVAVYCEAAGLNCQPSPLCVMVASLGTDSDARADLAAGCSNLVEETAYSNLVVGIAVEVQKEDLVV